jgi:glycerol-3-phosphate dehydrogenase (NAD(P)+)
VQDRREQRLAERQAERRAEPIAVIGAGSWGTALAIQLARAGNPTHLWGRDARQLDAMRRARCNQRYLPDAAFPDSLQVAMRLDAGIAAARDILIAVPSHAFRGTLAAVAPHLVSRSRIAWATKGFEAATGLLPHQVVREVLGPRPGAVLSGPTFAREVGAGLPTAMTVASSDEQFAHDLALTLTGPHFRAYTQSDIIGVEVGGAVKNVIAIGSGIADGMGFGANTRVALITRGLAEMMRLGVQLGAARETFMGLAGLGDLVLTCTDDQSRNRRFGIAIGRGATPGAAQEGIQQVVEGVPAARAVHDVAASLQVEMPICTEIYRVIYEGKPVRAAVQALMGREVRSESE